MRYLPLALSLLACGSRPSTEDPPTQGPYVYADDLDGDGATSDIDCDDDDPHVFPGQTEVCNGIDDDCDDSIDEDASDLSQWFADDDGDGFGDDADTVRACTAPSGFVATGGDCDDTERHVNPDATEVCNGIDDDCFDGADNGATDGDTFYADDDGDGFGDASMGFVACEAPSGFVEDDTDCDDLLDSVYPGAPEVPDDGVDQDCDGVDTTAGVGFYVSATLGTNGATGTMADPYLTVQEAASAASAAGGAPVYIAGGTYGEFVTTEVPLHGGFDDQTAGWPQTLDRTAVTLTKVTMTGGSAEAHTLTSSFGFVCNDGSVCAMHDVVGRGSIALEMDAGFPCTPGEATVSNSLFESTGSGYAIDASCGALTLTDSVVTGASGVLVSAAAADIERTEVTATSGIAFDLARGGTLRDNTVVASSTASFGALLQTGIPTDNGHALVVEGNSFQGGSVGVELRVRMDSRFVENTLTADDSGLRVDVVSQTPEPVVVVDDNDISVSGSDLAASSALYVSQAAEGEILRNRLHVGPTSVLTSARGAQLIAVGTVFADNLVYVESSPVRDYGVIVTNQFQADLAPVLVNNTIWVEGGGIASHALRDERATTTTTSLVAVNNVFAVGGGVDPSAIFKSVSGPLDATANLVHAPTASCMVQDVLHCYDDQVASACTMGWGTCIDMVVGDPLFTATSTGDFTVGSTSPAVDVGVDPVALGVATTAQAGTDITGTTRPVGGLWDLGLRAVSGLIRRRRARCRRDRAPARCSRGRR